MAERGLLMAHTAIMRWVQRYAPEFEKRWRRFAGAVGRSWRVDEIYDRRRRREPHFAELDTSTRLQRTNVRESP
jgi:transposase-like protein